MTALDSLTFRVESLADALTHQQQSYTATSDYGVYMTISNYIQ